MGNSSGSSFSFLAVDPTGAFLYAINPSLDVVSAYSIDAGGTLTFVNVEANSAIAGHLPGYIAIAKAHGCIDGHGWWVPGIGPFEDRA